MCILAKRNTKMLKFFEDVLKNNNKLLWKCGKLKSIMKIKKKLREIEIDKMCAF